MREIFGYFKGYFREINKTVLAISTLFIGAFIWYNYDTGMDDGISSQQNGFLRFGARYLVFFIAFTVPYFLTTIIKRRNFWENKTFILLVIIAPALFAFKMVMNTDLPLRNTIPSPAYWNQIFYWPARLAVLALILFILWKLVDKSDTFFGMSTRNFKWKPYFILLLMMVPLILAAATQNDFQRAYPKLHLVYPYIENLPNNWIYKLFFELSYGSDFISIELFFRGFLVLAFVKFAGKDAILPMACYYCTIHFGKPLGECISSYLGGMLLGAVVYHSRSIYGGLIVHLGIAWLMELAAIVW